VKNVILDNSVVNKLIGSDFTSNDNYNYLMVLKNERKIEVYAVPTNIIEIALCPDFEKRHALAKHFNSLIEGTKCLHFWDAYFVLFLFEAIEEQMPGTLIDKASLLSFSNNYVRLILGLLGQMSAIEDYNTGKFDYIVRQRLITKLYQARFLNDPDHYLKLYEQQLKNPLSPMQIDDDSMYDRLSLIDLNNKIDELKENRKPISNIKKYSSVKKGLIEFFARHELKNLFIAFFPHKEEMEAALNLKNLAANWDNQLFETGAKPLPEELHQILIDEHSRPSLDAYRVLLLKLVDRLPSRCLFPLDQMMNIYLNEMEKIINGTKDPSEGSALDLDYYPGCLMANHFITDDHDLFTDIRRMLIKKGLHVDKVVSFSGDWRAVIG